jgi:uncharacterized membrane protein YhaH (DUF805 family)
MPTHDLPYDRPYGDESSYDDEPLRPRYPAGLGPEGPVGLDALLSFEGRVARGTFWVTWLGLGAAGLAAVIGASVFIGGPHRSGIFALATAVSAVLIMICGLLFFFMGIANEAKRWHDMNKSAWWLLLNLIPGIGPIVFLVLGLMPGTKGPNKFGEAPLKIRLNPDSLSS